jgi:RNA polymerase sigma factor (sigma-70 family)
VTSSALDALTPEVVDRATLGDGAALDVILSTLSRPFYNLALRMLQNHEDAEDAAQECLIRVATKLSTFRGESRFSSWAWTVATRSVLDFREGRARKAALTSEAFSLDLADGLEAAATVESPEDRIYAAQVKLGCGRAMLQVLDGDHRIAYTLTEILGLDQSEAAAALGLSHAALRKRLSRARSRIREVLGSNCGIVDEGNACRCQGRRERAITLNRLEAQDAVELDLDALRDQIRALDELRADVAYYRGDPLASPSERLLPTVRAILRLN